MTDQLRQVGEVTALRAQRTRLRAEALERELTVLRRQGRVVPFTRTAARTLLS